MSAEIEDDKGNKGKLNWEDEIKKLKEADEVFDERTKVTVNNGVKREIPVNEALAELWQMVYEIRSSIVFFIDVAKVYRPLIKFYKDYRPQIRGFIYFMATLIMGGLMILGVKFNDLVLQWLKSIL